MQLVSSLSETGRSHVMLVPYNQLLNKTQYDSRKLRPPSTLIVVTCVPFKVDMPTFGSIVILQNNGIQVS